MRSILPKTQPQIAAKQLDDLLVNWPLSLLGGLAAMAAFLFIFYGQAPSSTLFWWGGVALGLNSLRWAQWIYCRPRILKGEGGQGLILGYTVLSFAESIWWGSVGLIFFVPESPLHLVFLVSLLVGVSSAGQALNYSYLPVAIFHPIAVMLPLGVMLGQQDNDILTTMAVLVVVFTLILGVVGYRSNKTIHSNWRLQRQLAARDGELTAAQTFLQQILDSVPGPIFVKDTNHRWVNLNQAFCTLLGREQTELLGKTDSDFFSPEEAEVFREKDEQVLRSGDLDVNEEWFTDTGGYRHRIVTRKTTFTLPDGETYLVGVINDVTQLREANDELAREVEERRQIEERLRLIADNIPAVVVYVDRDERYQFVNKRMEEWFAQPADQLIGRTVAEVVGSETYDAIRWTIDRAFAGIASSFEYDADLPNKDRRSFSSDIIPQTSAQGEVQGYYVLTLDITERRHAEKALKENENRLRLIADNMPAYVGYADKEGRYQFVNRFYERAFERPRDEIIGLTPRDLMLPENYERYGPSYEEALTGMRLNRDIEIDYRGEMHVLNVSYTPDIDEDGVLQGVYSLALDITQRRRSEEALRESESRLRAIYESAGVGIALVDPSGRYIQYNPAFGLMLGYDETELIGRSFLDITHPEEARSNSAQFAELCAGGVERYQYEKKCVRKDGSICWVDLQASALWGQDGALEHVLAVVKDISAQKDAVEKLGKQERLAALGELTATVSHELRNPMGTIRNSFFVIDELTRDKALGVDRALDRAERNIGRCDRIIGDLLDYTRMRDIDQTPVLVDRLIEETLAEFQTHPDIAFEIQLGVPEAPVPLDVDQFRRVIINLFDNATQALDGLAPEACPAEGKKITVSTRVSAGRYEMSIIDNGPGIPPENLPRLFEPLFSTKSYGTGLGLPTVRNIVEQHGGQITAGVSEGGGARFDLWLPLHDAKQNAA